MPQTCMEHQRRLRFFETSQKAQAQVCSAHRLRRAASPVATRPLQAIHPCPAEGLDWPRHGADPKSARPALEVNSSPAGA
ncbi:hypothetical protein WP39_08935 [Streptomyces sp. 604F]|nr:hypothetical protein [Streptomyces sp. 604F]